MVRGILDDVLTRKRTLVYKKKEETAPFPIVWVQTFGPATSEINALVKKANAALKLSPCWKDVERPMGVVSRRGKNLGDLILNRKKFSLDPGTPNLGTIRCTPEEGPRKRGQPCKSCKLMSGSPTITSRVDKKTHKVPGGDCSTKGVIYAAECFCKFQYVGQTVTPLRTRINGHRAWMSKKKKDDEGDPDGFRRKDEGALAEHLKKDHELSTPDEFDRSYKFHILETNPKSFDKAEQLWVNRLITMDPLGLNLDRPCGVSATILEMLSRQKQMDH